MSLVSRLERNIYGLQRKIEKEYDKIGSIHKKYVNKKMSSAEFNLKKKKIDDKIREMDSRMRVLKGSLAKERRRLEEKSEEKRKHAKIT